MQSTSSTSKFLESIFEDTDSNQAGIKTLVNEECINKLKSFTIPTRINVSTGEHSIVLNGGFQAFTPLVLPSSRNLDPANDCWHAILIYHGGFATKADILNELFDVADTAFFVPMAYRREKKVDFFFICKQTEFLEKLLFEKSLQITVNQVVLPMVMKMNVSNFHEGQLKPIKCILSLIIRKMNESNPNVLDFSNVTKEKEMAECFISLRNKAVLMMFLDQLNSMKNLKASVRILKLDDNHIRTLEPFQSKLYGFNNIKILSLTKNKLKDIYELKHLKNLMLDEIYVEGNFGVQTSKALLIKYNESKIQDLLPTLKKINGIALTNAVPYLIGEGKNGNREIENVGDGVLINQSNVKNYKFEKLLKDYCWTKVKFVHNKKFSSTEILNHLTSTILKDVFFFPCYFKRIRYFDEFFLYKNPDALAILFNLPGLKIQMPTSYNFDVRNSFPISISFNFNCAEFNENEVFWWSKIIKAVGNSIKDNVLDLNNFPRREDFDKILISMNSTKTIDFIMTQAKKINPNITRIDFENCDLMNCEGFHFVFTLSKLTLINLRNNKLTSLYGFKRCPSICEILLDGNPMCNKSPNEYIRQVIEYLPDIKKIDGVQLQSMVLLANFQNYLANTACYHPVNSFIKTFFETWDSFERMKILDMYNNKSIMTLSIHVEYREQNSTLTFSGVYPRVQTLVAMGRNLLKISNMNQVCDNVFIGKDIQKVFYTILRTKHNFTTFTIDVPLYEPDLGRMILVVRGAFEEFESDIATSSIIYGFTRQFCLMSTADGIINVQNDQLTICCPSDEQRLAIKDNIQPATDKEVQETCRDLIPTACEEHTAKLFILQELTKCSKEFCQQLLKDSCYDLKVALACFNTYIDANQIPDDKFIFN